MKAKLVHASTETEVFVSTVHIALANEHHEEYNELSNPFVGSIPEEKHQKLRPELELRPSGLSLAQGTDFTRLSRRSLWGVDADVFRVENLYGPEEIREDFIKNIDNGAAFDFCKVCKKRHIPPGPPFTLQDRDTCGSYLPEYVSTFSPKI